ncbi:MAG: M14 family zinc carboxypeptidase [Candidatus Thermoplasmatota archaeon]
MVGAIMYRAAATVVTFCVIGLLLATMGQGPYHEHRGVLLDAASQVPEEVEPAAAPPVQPYAGLTVYHSYTELSDELQQIAQDHPSITKLASIGKSWQSRDLWAMKISDNPEVEEDEPEIYFNSNHHAREWMTIEIALYIINFLTDNYGTNATVTDIVNTRQVWVIPCANPDGREYDSPGDDPTNHARQPYGWRKNCRDNNGNFIFEETQDGVDPNRNYGYMWGASGASPDPTSDTYGGPGAFSEPECSAIRDFCRQHDFVFAISYHTYSQLILYPWGYTYASAPDEALFQAVANEMSARITNTAGSAYPGYTPQQSSDLYMTSGSDDDWLYGELGIYAYCIEAYPNLNDNDAAVVAPYDLFHPRADKVPLVCADNIGAAMYLCQIADNPFQVIDHVSLSPQSEWIKINDGGTGSLSINVTNDGRRDDTFTLATSTIPGWTVSILPASIALVRNQTSQSTLTVTVPAGETPGSYRIWVNATSNTNASCRASCIITVEVPWDEDVSAISISPFVEMGSYPLGAYAINGTVRNVGELQVPIFESRCTITKFGSSTSTTLFSDNMESGTTNWVVVDHDGSTSISYWHRVTDRSNSPTSSWWCGPAAGGNYNDMTVQCLEMSGTVSLREATGANLTYWTYYSTEANYDFCVVEGSRDGGRTWEYITRYHGAGAAWTGRTNSLSQFLGAEEVKVRFRFTSDEGTNAIGFWLDDVSIIAELPSETLVFGPAADSTSGPLAPESEEVLGWVYTFTSGGRYRVSVDTVYGADGNSANNHTDVIIEIDPTRMLPDFAGVEKVENPGTGTTLEVSWSPANDPNVPITYRLWRFDHLPTEAEVNSTVPTWTGAALSHVDSGLFPSTTYWYVVRAEDALGQRDYNMVTKSAITDELLFFQAQAPFAGYRNLNLDPFETAVQIFASTALSAVGAYQIGERWLSDVYLNPQEMNGTWKFRVYGQVDRATANGYLYTKVYENGTVPALKFSAQDDEDIAGFVGTYHEFYWEYNVPAGTTLSAGSRFYVELWLNVTGESAGPASRTYTYSGTTQLGGPHDAWFCDVDLASTAEFDVPNSRIELTDVQYTQINSSNDVRAVSADPGLGDMMFMKYSMAISEDPATITQITMTHEAQYSAAVTCTLYAKNATSGSWDIIGATMVFSANIDATMTRSITANCANYISGGRLQWGVYPNTQAIARVDYVQTVIDYTASAAVFTFGYDNDATQSAVHPELNYYDEPDIGPLVAGWNLVSLPKVPFNSALPDALLDTDGDTFWDRVVWYDAQAPTGAKWKQYYTAWDSTLNDLTVVDHRMGVWLYVTAPGNGFINISGSIPASTTINLYTGWNLIGYPATDDSTYTVGQLKTATGATYVEGFNATEEYKTAVLADTYVLKKGEAYWVYVPADTIWTVNW